MTRGIKPTPTSICLICHNLAKQPAHERLHDVVSVLLSSINKNNTSRKASFIEKSTLIQVVPRLPAMCHLLYLVSQVYRCSVQKWIPSIVSLRSRRNHLAAPGVSTSLIFEVCLKRNSCMKVRFSCEGQTHLAYLVFPIAVDFCALLDHSCKVTFFLAPIHRGFHFQVTSWYIVNKNRRSSYLWADVQAHAALSLYRTLRTPHSLKVTCCNSPKHWALNNKHTL